MVCMHELGTCDFWPDGVAAVSEAGRVVCGSTPSPCWTPCRASLCRSSPSSRSACCGSSAVQTGWVVHVCTGVLCALLVLQVLCPQLSLAGTATACTGIIYVMTKKLLQQRCVCCDKTIFCCDKSMLVVTKLLWWQNGVCCDKIFLWQNICQDKHTFVVTAFVTTDMFVTRKSFVATNIILSWHMFCCDKHTFVMAKDVLCCDKHVFVGTNTCLSQQKVCRDKNDTCGSSCQWYAAVSIWFGGQMLPGTLRFVPTVLLDIFMLLKCVVTCIRK